MASLIEAPSLSADPIEHADFLELECLHQSDRNASGSDLAAALKRLDDDAPEDRPISDVRMERIVEAAFDELTDRTEHSGAGHYRYPFRVDAATEYLKLRGGRRPDLYLFLLLATRMNMQKDRVQGGIDGTLLFEQICCEVAKNYWGHRTKSLVFGTARRRDGSEVGGFVDAVNDLCTQMSEGVDFFPHHSDNPTAQDGKLDVVVWKSFADGRVGKLIGFGQCKTGTHWKSGLFTLQPEGFCAKWVRTRPAVLPVPLFFITARVRKGQWGDACVDGGIMFDRCRILEFAPPMPSLREQWKVWTNAALTANDLEAWL